MAFEEILPILPYVGILSLLIALGIIVYHFGKWRQKTESDREEMRKMLDAVSKKVDRIPDDFWAKFIDAYKLLEKVKEENPEVTKKRRPKDDQ